MVAESGGFEEVAGGMSFPPEALERVFAQPAEQITIYGWQGTASHFDLVDDDEAAPAALWSCRELPPAAPDIEDHVAFCCPPVRIES